MQPILTGLDHCLRNPPPVLEGARFGLLMNQASVDQDLRDSCLGLAERFPGQLKALFSPQHGLWGEQQANMVESGDSRYPPLNLPVYSLYSETRRPTAEMLNGLDCLLIDLQDVGTRVYTFVWTVLECMRACAEANVRVIVLDRPNPLGGTTVEGPMLEDGYRSFVGNASIPLRHGLTLAELARLLNVEERVGADLHVIPMTGWRRGMSFSQTGRTWLPPSPNMPRIDTALVYPGQVLLEGTNLSEGRGTTRPFEFVGAPFLDPWLLARELEPFCPPGLRVRPVRCVPTFDKHSGQSCGGVALHVVHDGNVRTVALTVGLIAAARRLAPGDFEWLPPPYEYEYHKPPLDILFGSNRLRIRLERDPNVSPAEVEDLIRFDVRAWWRRVEPFLLYPFA